MPGGRVEIEWHKSVDTTGKYVMIMARLVGTEYVKQYGPIPAKIADSFIRAKRDAIRRAMWTRAQAVQVFSDPERRL